MMKDIKMNYSYGYGHLSGAISGYRLMQGMKKKGLKLDFDQAFTIADLLDDVINDIKDEVEKEAIEHYKTYGG